MDLEAATTEVIRLHDFLGAWFRGELKRERLAPDFADVLAPEFENVQPAGDVRTRGELITMIGGAHGTNPDFRITIENPRLLGAWPGLALFQYVEAQTGARASRSDNRRLSTVLFQTARRPVWRYLTEVDLTR